MSRKKRPRAAHTNAALLALVARALGDEAPRAESTLVRAHAPAHEKRALPDALLERDGPEAVLRVGRGIRDAGFVPVLHVLLRAATPAVLAEKWMRLEGYYHSHHRTRIDATRDGRWRCRRSSLGTGAPRRAENLLICGVQSALLERLGCRDVTATLEGADARAWVLRWSSFERGPAVAQGSLPAREEPEGLRLDGDVSRLVARRIEEDLDRRWRMVDLAGVLGRSTRALQRALAREGASATRILRGLRVREACRLLSASELSLADIGYGCGFADQAHFQRQFRQATGLTPAVYRSEVRSA